MLLLSKDWVNALFVEVDQLGSLLGSGPCLKGRSVGIASELQDWFIERTKNPDTMAVEARNSVASVEELKYVSEVRLGSSLMGLELCAREGSDVCDCFLGLVFSLEELGAADHF